MIIAMIAGILTAAASEPDAGSDSGNMASIPKHRRGAWVLKFCEQSGEPLALGELDVQRVAHDFLVGTPIDPGQAGAGIAALEAGANGIMNLVVLPKIHDEAQFDSLVIQAEMGGYTVMASCPPGLVDETALRAAMGRHAGHIKVWEVVVDPLQADTPPNVAAQLFKTARVLDPDATLLMAQSEVEQPGRAGRLAAFVQQCVDAGADLDGASIGGDWSRPEGVWEAVERLTKTGIPVLVKGVPADHAGEALTRCSAIKGTMGVVLGKKSDRSVGSDRSVRLESGMSGSMAPAQWTIRASLTTDGEGTVRFEGLYGDYEIVLDGHVWKAPLRADTPATLEFRRPPTVEPPDAFEDPFVATRAAEARAWQEEIRVRLLDIVSAQNPRQEHPLQVDMGEPADHGGYTARDLLFTGNEGQRIETTLTVPKGEGPFPAMVCLHGHGGDRSMVHDPESNYGGLAVPFAQRGFVTIAPTLEHREYAPNHLWNLMRLVDVLQTREDVDEDRIGVAGLSMGGEWTMWLAATDLRVKAAVVSGWMCTTQGVLSIHNCPCWMPPGLLELCDIADVHILIAPRPLLFESAVGDGCFPIRCTREGYWRVLRGYAVLGAPLNVRQHTFPGGHAWNGGVAYDFIERALK